MKCASCCFSVSFTYLLFQIYLLTVFVVLTTAMSTRAVTQETELEFCKNVCEFAFFMCITDACPQATWPRNVPQYCLDDREECLEECFQKHPE